jgi:hypothetical protein
MSNEDPVFIVDLNELEDDDLVPVAMDFTLDHGPGVRSTNVVRPEVGAWVRIHSDADDTLYHARVTRYLNERDLMVRIDWQSCTPVLNRVEWSARGVNWSMDGVTASV